VETSVDFDILNPIDRCLYAKTQADEYTAQATRLVKTDEAASKEYADAAALWYRVATPIPGGWREEDDDGQGPWWYVFEEAGKTKVAARGSPTYELIKRAISSKRK
jgi:hypothetical protein